VAYNIIELGSGKWTGLLRSTGTHSDAPFPASLHDINANGTCAWLRFAPWADPPLSLAIFEDGVLKAVATRTADSQSGFRSYSVSPSFTTVSEKAYSVDLPPETWELVLGEPPEGTTLDSEPPEGDIPVEDVATISWTSPTPCRPYALRNGVMDAEFNPVASTAGEAEIGGVLGDVVAVNLTQVPTVPLPTHFRAVWFASSPDNEMDVDGVAHQYRVNGSIQPFAVGSVSSSEALAIATASGWVDRCMIQFFASDEVTSALFQGEVDWECPTNPILGGQEGGCVWGDLRPGHLSTSRHPGDRYRHDFNNVYSTPHLGWKILAIRPDQPPDTVEPQPEEPIGGGPLPPVPPEPPEPEPPEVEPPPVPEGGPGPTEPIPGTKPEPTLECVCAVFLLYIGDWVQNVSINIWNLCQYVFQITGVLETWLRWLGETLRDALWWIGESLDYMQNYFEFFLEEWKRSNDALEKIGDEIELFREAFESKPPIDVVVADDEVMVHGVEAEEDLPEVYTRRGVK